MGGHDKSREELTQELQALRQELAGLRRQARATPGRQTDPVAEAPRAPRGAVHMPIAFAGDFSLVKAQGVDLSEGGVCFEVQDDLLFEMEFELEGEVHRHKARVVWMKRLEDGRSRWGFQFVESDSLFLLDAYRSLDE